MTTLLSDLCDLSDMGLTAQLLTHLCYSLYHWILAFLRCSVKTCRVSRPAYLSVFDCICMEIGLQYGCTCIFKKVMDKEFPKKYGNSDMNECELLPAKSIVR